MRWLEIMNRLSIALPAGKRAKQKSERYRRYSEGYRAVHVVEKSAEEMRVLFDRTTSRDSRIGLCVAALRSRRGWNPVIELVGMENLERAAARGRGVILWFDNFVLHSLVGKRALAEAGHRIWYLSNYAHGLSSYSRFSDRFLNWRRIEAELRYLAGRIVMTEGNTVVATRRIVEILAENGVVGIANNAYMGKTISVPFGAARLVLARAPLNLAAKRGAALLPVAVIEVEPFARFEVRIGSEIKAEAGVGDAIASTALAYARYLIPLAKTHPDQWDWSNLRVSRS